MLAETHHSLQRRQDRGFNNWLTSTLVHQSDVLQHRLSATLFVSCSRKRLREAARKLREQSEQTMRCANEAPSRQLRKTLKQQSRELRQAADKLERKNRPYFIATATDGTIITYGYQYRRLRHKTTQSPAK